MASNNEVKEEYASSLRDLTFNSKPLISVLTILAEENLAHAKDIVEVIENHLARVRTEVKLPVLYLIDCIIKNVGREYTTLFCQNIVSTFCSVFEQVDEKTRAEMFRLRQTWNDVLPQKKLYALDVQIQQLDPAWPVTAPPPNNSIHFNPKFLKSTPAAVSKANSGNIIPVTNVSSVDPETLSMQQKLINKQKELLELQQRKLELELLQTQVRLQEQLKSKTGPSSATDTKTVTSQKTTVPHSQNLLLKPGAVKEIMSTAPTRTVSNNLRTKINSQNISTMKNQRLQQQQQQQPPTPNLSNVVPRIAPVNSALVNAQRPIRDPRLLRLQEKQQQQEQQQLQQQQSSHSPLENVNSNVHLDSKSKTTSPQMIHSENKVVTNKMSVRDNRTEPRSVSKSKAFGQGKNKPVPRSSPSPSKIGSSKLISPKKSSKFARSSSKLSPSSTSDLSNSSSPIDSPSKNKNGFYSKNRSPNKSPVKSKKKSISAMLDGEKVTQKEPYTAPPDRDAEKAPSAVDGADVASTDKKGDKLPKIPKSDKTVNKTIKSDSPTAIKELKMSSKNRNYIRRNREPSLSPEPPHDVDLRLTAPPEKQPRLQGEPTDTKTSILDDNIDISTSPNMDVDLRQLPAVIGKKRLSSETMESPSAKKTKSELFDVLFGSEDTDLRQLPPVMSPPRVVERPKTPPPPIISEIKETLSDLPSENKDIKEGERRESPKKANLDLVRAKLANATHRDKIEKARLHITGDRGDLKTQEDTDMRMLGSLDKIIISPADEQSIKAGNMTKAQETALMNKIIAQIETQKLREAQRKESESIANISLQPISDDELEIDGDLNGSDSDSGGYSKHADFGDRDDRVAPPSINYHGEENYSKQGRGLEPREMRRPAWRGRRGRPVWDTHPGASSSFRPAFRGRPEPWMRTPNQGPWRPMNSAYGKSHMHSDNFNQPENQGQVSHGSPNAFPTNEEGPNDIVTQSNEKTINIDGIPRNIRYYDETAVIFMNWDDPREISFQNGGRRVTFDDKSTFLLSFNEPYRDVLINGSPHRIRFGGPTKEIFIDNKGHECYFGSPGVQLEIDGIMVHVKLEGPPPQVRIGNFKRMDLVAGRISLIIDAKIIIYVYLDSTLQQFDLDGKTHTLKFVDALRKVIINDVMYPVEFGGLPKPATLLGAKHFIRFSMLPKGVKPGQVSIKDMELNQMHESSPILENENSQDDFPNMESNVAEPAMPIRRKFPQLPEEDTDKNSNDPQMFQNFIHQQNINNLDLLSNVMVSSITSPANISSYQIEGESDSQLDHDTSNPSSVPEERQKPAIPPVLNINELFQKLVATGIVTTSSTTVLNPTKSPETTPVSTVTMTTPSPMPAPKLHITPKSQKILSVSKPVYFDKPDTLKMRQSSLIQALYVGMQCSSCGMRFPPELSMHYSQHLDWHFRQNRKGKKNIRKAASRRWYYTLSDWKNFEEIEDIEEREKSYFENQSHVEGNANEDEEEIEIPSVPADPDIQDACCEVCKERFEQFYNEEKEEWHLRMAVRIDGKTYHPLCHEDYLASLVDQAVLEDSNRLSMSQTDDEENKESIPGLEVSDEPVILDDDEPEVVEETPSAEVGDEALKEVVPKETVINGSADKQEGDDDDVIINEVIPEKIVVDDDDEGEEEKEASDKSKTEAVTIKEEPIDDDGFIDVEEGLLQIKAGGEVKIKTEPIDPDELVMEHREQERPGSAQGHVEFKPSIDGNVEYDSTSIPTTSATIGGKIKINISKPIMTTAASREPKEPSLEDEALSVGHEICVDPSQPLPPGEEPVQLNIKPTLQGVQLKKLPVVRKGTELTGMCSIM